MTEINEEAIRQKLWEKCEMDFKKVIVRNEVIEFQTNQIYGEMIPVMDDIGYKLLNVEADTENRIIVKFILKEESRKFVYFMRDDLDDVDGKFSVFATKEEAIEWNGWQYPKRDDGKTHKVIQAVYQIPKKYEKCDSKYDLVVALERDGIIQDYDGLDFFLVSSERKEVEGTL